MITFWGFEIPQAASPTGDALRASDPNAGRSGYSAGTGSVGNPSPAPASLADASDRVRERRAAWWLWPLLWLLGLFLLLVFGRGCLPGCTAPVEMGWLRSLPGLRVPGFRPQAAAPGSTTGSALDTRIGSSGSHEGAAVGSAEMAGGGADGNTAANLPGATPSSDLSVAGAAAGAAAGGGDRAQDDPAAAHEPPAAEEGANEQAAAARVDDPPAGPADESPPGPDGDHRQAGGGEASPAEQDASAAAPDDASPGTAPPASTAPVSEDLQIPPVKDPPSFEFLRGRWQTTTDLYGGPENVPVAIEYEFDGSGRGKTTVRQRRGGACQSDAQAVFDPTGTLRIRDTSPPTCSDGSRYVPSEVRCSVGPDGKARCRGLQDNGNPFRAQMQRAED